MKVLVTGATSMIGRKTVEELLRRGHDVQILQRGSSDLEVPVFRGDIRDADAVQKAVSGCDVVIHAAAKVGLVGRISEFRDINVVGTQHVMSAAVAAGARGVVDVESHLPLLDVHELASVDEPHFEVRVFAPHRQELHVVLIDPHAQALHAGQSGIGAMPVGLW